MSGSIPFSIPSEFASGLADGSLLRVGALLKETGTGQIVAHVQETGIAQNLANGVMNGALLPLGSLDLASSGFANFQLAQLKTMVEGLQVLQYANLGVALGGIGVSAIGFAAVNKRLNCLEKQILSLGDKIEKYFADLSQSQLRQHYSQVYTLFEMADQAVYLKNPHPELLTVASQLARESGYFRGEVAYLLKQDNFDTGLFASLSRSLALCNAGRIECLMLARELPAARKVAEDNGKTYRGLFDPLVPSKLAIRMLPVEERWNEGAANMLKKHNAEMKQLVQGVRDATDAALTKPHLIDTLIEKDIDGHDYVRRLREEQDNPIMLLRSN